MTSNLLTPDFGHGWTGAELINIKANMSYIADTLEEFKTSIASKLEIANGGCPSPKWMNQWMAQTRRSNFILIEGDL